MELSKLKPANNLLDQIDNLEKEIYRLKSILKEDINSIYFTSCKSTETSKSNSKFKEAWIHHGRVFLNSLISDLSRQKQALQREFDRL